MSNRFRDYYKSMYFSGIYTSPHRYVYSGKLAGAMYAVSEIKDAIPIIHGPSGCGFHYKYTCRREYLPSYNSQCTNLKEKDIIFGGEDKLRNTILETARKYSPSIIAVMPAVSVDMIHDEIDSVVESLKSKIDCKLISIKSEKFSHVDKRNRKSIIEQRVKNWDNYDYKDDINFEGCGFVETMKALVEQVMEKQKITKNLVNICGLAWGNGGNAIIHGMIRELEYLGISINSIIPNCTTKEIAEAPKAELNIITRRTQWADKMEKSFGTRYFRISSFDFYRGPEGIERLYTKISEALGIEKKTAQILSRRKKDTIEALRQAKEYFKGFEFALLSSSYRDIPHIIEKYEIDFGMPLRYVCVEMRKKSLNLDMVSEETEKELVESMHRAISKTNSKAQLLINPSLNEIKEAFRDVDYVIGGSQTGYKFDGVKHIQGLENVMPLDFEGFKKVVNNFAVRIEKTSYEDNLLIEKFKYLDGHYPLLDNDNINGAQQMWEKMWMQRRF